MQSGNGKEGAAAPNGSGQFSRACPSDECREARCAPLKDVDIELLACIAARLAGQDPDRHTRIKLGDEVAFDDLAWRYPDFIARAEADYSVLAGERCPEDLFS